MDERRVDSRVAVEEEEEVSTNWVSQQTCRKRLLAWRFQCVPACQISIEKMSENRENDKNEFILIILV